MRYLLLNRAGNSEDNPILADMVNYDIRFLVTLYKQDSSEQLKQCWIRADNRIYTVLTDLCGETDYTIYVTIINGKHTYAPSYTPTLNTIYFTTTKGVAKYGFYIARCPNKMITLDGYDAHDSGSPLIYPIYRS